MSAGAARAAFVPLVMIVGLLAVELHPEAAAADAGAAGEGRGLLDGLVAQPREVDHRGEIVCLTWSEGRTHQEVVHVVGSRDGLLLSAGHGPPVRVGGPGGELPTALSGAEDRLRDKYDASVTGAQRILGRATTRLEIRVRDGGLLRERLWVDDATGLVLRRESYDGDMLLRLAAYRTLDMDPPLRRGGVSPVSATAERLLEARPAAAPEVDPRASVADTGAAAWQPPAELPHDYRRGGAFPGGGSGGEAVQHVYHDGLYAVSVFVQPGRPDWGTLPRGARRVEGFGGPAYEWPGAVPHRLVWEAGGSTFTLVGDAPPDEFADIAKALPPPSPGVLRRLADGFARLWGMFSS